MKFFIKSTLLMTILLLNLTACDLEDPIESTITQYAEFEVTGGPYLYVDLDSDFEDPGVVATAGEEVLDVEVSGSVDTSTPGVYVLEYSAVNEDGFPATTSRYVAVGDMEVAFGRDLSGTYFTGSRTNTVTLIQPGFYLNSDTLPNNSISVFMVDLGNGNLIIPPQSSRFGTVAADPSLYPGSFVTLDSPTSFTIAQFISCCGIFTRTFTL